MTLLGKRSKFGRFVGPCRLGGDGRSGIATYRLVELVLRHPQLERHVLHEVEERVVLDDRDLAVAHHELFLDRVVGRCPGCRRVTIGLLLR